MVDIIFITDQSDQGPQFKVSVWDSQFHCVGCPQQADVGLIRVTRLVPAYRTFLKTPLSAR